MPAVESIPQFEPLKSTFIDLKSQLISLRKGQKVWKFKKVSERLLPLHELREMISRDSDKIANVLSQENGKTPLESLTQEIIPTLDTIHYLIKRSESILHAKKINLLTKQFYFRGKENFMVYEPYGVIGILGTWNYPFYLCMSQVLFALVAGNAVILKGSEISERITDIIQEYLINAGFPEDILHIFSSGSVGGEALCKVGCDKYILTGSRQTGKAVLKILANDLKPAVMELSGSDPYIILKDADWELACRTLLWAGFQYSGQTCVAPRRIYCLHSDKERFLKMMKKVWDENKEYISSQGMLRTALQAEHEKEKIIHLEQMGAKLELGDEKVDEQSSFIPCRIYSNVEPDQIGELDFMAPVMFLQTASSEEELMALAGQTSFALGGSLWTGSAEKAKAWVRYIKAGQVWVNDSIFSVALGEIPFGGYGSSGFGKTRGPEGLLEMVEHKFVSMDWRSKRANRHLPPYPKGSYAIVTAIQRVLYRKKWSDKLKAIALMMKAVAFKK